MSNPFIVYIKVIVPYYKHKPEWFHALIDTGSGVSLANSRIYPKSYWKDYKPLTVQGINSEQITLGTCRIKTLIQIEDYILSIPILQSYNHMGADKLLGVNFLRQFIYIMTNEAITLKTPCNHSITAPRIYSPIRRTTRKLHFRSSQCGEYNIKFNQIISYYEKILEKIDKNFGENPIQLWEIDQTYAKIELKDPNVIIRVKPMRYRQEDRQEFDKQIKELLELKIIRESKSPHSSPAFIVRNHAEIK